jgi:hypothetical protein
VSVAVTHTESSELTPIVTNAKLQSGCVPDEALALIIAAQITEEFRDFLLVIAFQPGVSCWPGSGPSRKQSEITRREGNYGKSDGSDSE